MTTRCHIHLPGPRGIGTHTCPACANMIRLAGELATDTNTRGKAGARANKAKSLSPWRRGLAKEPRALVPVRGDSR